jgi:hypothetical protein
MKSKEVILVSVFSKKNSMARSVPIMEHIL